LKSFLWAPHWAPVFFYTHTLLEKFKSKEEYIILVIPCINRQSFLQGAKVIIIFLHPPCISQWILRIFSLGGKGLHAR
jgi:hypothetical protein